MELVGESSKAVIDDMMKRTYNITRHTNYMHYINITRIQKYISVQFI